MTPRVRIWLTVIAASGLATVVAVGWLLLSPAGDGGPLGPGPAPSPLTVHLFVAPSQVQHMPRFRFAFDPPEVLQQLRLDEGLDVIVHGAGSDEELCRRLMRWTRAQWEPGRPDPYPPPDARIILRDIRSGFTGGFCAQYCFVLVQAISSFGLQARCVTIRGHEVMEAWLRDEQRWTMLDPLYALQVLDAEGRSLNANQIRLAVAGGNRMRLLDGNRCGESPADYLARFRQLAVWIRNDFVSHPMNFVDFDRYRVWLAPPDDVAVPSVSLTTPFPLDLYAGPETLPAPPAG